MVVGFNATSGAYIKPDYKRWAEDHAIEQRGRDERRSKFPPTDQTTLDGTHLEIQEYISGLAKGCRQEVTPVRRVVP